jgi:hypothetical protein
MKTLNIFFAGIGFSFFCLIQLAFLLEAELIDWHFPWWKVILFFAPAYWVFAFWHRKSL